MVIKSRNRGYAKYVEILTHLRMPEGKKPFGEPGCRGEDNIKISVK
jgi:hypothetical protein